MSESPSLDPAQARAVELLSHVRTDAPQGDERFVPDLMRRVRVQRAVVRPLRTLGNFLAAVAGGIGAAVRTGSRRSGS